MTADEYHAYVSRQTTPELRVINERLSAWRTQTMSDESTRLSRMSMIAAELHRRARKAVYGA